MTLFKASSFSQGQWAWMGGDTVSATAPVYGTRGIPDPDNRPGMRYSSATWTDAAGKFWLFGGRSYDDNTGFVGARNDLWKYDPQSNLWAWVHGDTLTDVVTRLGKYGTKGVPSTLNNPGAVDTGCLTWVDDDGNLWLFGGGFQTNVRCDLWRYNPGTDEWTWIKGSGQLAQKGIYGTKGLASPTNAPGGRVECSSSWVDYNGNFWMYGGEGYDINGTFGYLGDLWRYEPSNNMWTWMSGDNTVNKPAVYGTKGVPNSSNKPGAREVYATNWKDSIGNLYLFGGDKPVGYLTQQLNDLWRYDIANNQWTWISGDSSSNHLSIYGSKCVPDVANMPGSRSETRATWTDNHCNFWVFGGFQKFIAGYQTYNDLWHYNLAKDRWTWIAGDSTFNEASVYGSKNVPGPAIKPGYKFGTVSWMDNGGNFWLYGGNDGKGNMWKFVPDTACATTNCDVVIIPDPPIEVENCENIYVPNSFSPNADGNNDEFKIIGSGIKDFHFIIFNRWGETVFESIDPSIGWDGRQEGMVLSPEVFIYRLKLTCFSGSEIIRNGNISLIR